MPTYIQRELAGVSPIYKPALPSKPKFYSDLEYEKRNEMALYQKELSELEDEIQVYNKWKELANVIDIRQSVKHTIEEQIEEWGLKYIQVQNSPRLAA